MITREQVADLNRGDVVEFHASYWGEGAVVRGPLREDEDGCLYVGPMRVRSEIGAPPHGQDWALTVVSRAPRPLYVNHDRTEPVQHDVVRDGGGVIRHCDATGFAGKPTWWAFGVVEGRKWTHDTYPPQPLTLLVDGETGQVVPS